MDMHGLAPTSPVAWRVLEHSRNVLSAVGAATIADVVGIQLIPVTFDEDVGTTGTICAFTLLVIYVAHVGEADARVQCNFACAA